MYKNKPELIAYSSSSGIFLLLLYSLLLNGCSIHQFALNQVSDAIASGGEIFSSDNDLELVRDASPFSLKLMESLLAGNPKHRGLLLAAAKGFTQYSYAYLQLEADMLESTDFKASNKLRNRAKHLYARAKDYGLRGLEINHTNFSTNLFKDPKVTIFNTDISDVPLLYWTAVSWAAMISMSKDEPESLADLPLVELLIDRALALDDGYDSGAIHNFLISYESARQGVKGDPAKRSRKHFEKAVELSDGLQVAPYVSMAETVSIKKQDKKEFQSLLMQALAIEISIKPAWKLQNLIMQRRAHWLLAHIDDFF